MEALPEVADAIRQHNKLLDWESELANVVTGKLHQAVFGLGGMFLGLLVV